MIVTFAVLLFLNIYSAKTSQKIFYTSKEISMMEKSLSAANMIGEADVMNASTITDVIESMNNLTSARIIVTDIYGGIIYDSTGLEAAGSYALLPEIMQALNGNDVFTWSYHNGNIYSRAAAPIFSNGSISGCLYMTESDYAQGALIQKLQRNILFISVILEIAVILFSIIFVIDFSKRLRRIRSSMRIIRSGDYSHKVQMGGHDELTLLGDEFDALTEKLQASEEQRRRFVSDASHELKTPLASIKLLSDSILQNDMDADTVKEFLEDIGNEADRLNRMSVKLLSLSKIEAGGESSLEIVNVIPTIERVSRMLTALASEQKVKIIHDFKAACPVLIQQDDLYQIIFNLVENGIKYNTPGGTLTITTTTEDDNAVLKFIDTGVGIPEESLSKIFERFYRVDKARSRKSGGSGLGLSIVKDMVERNAGTIEVSSKTGEGTVFTVVFPLFDTEDSI